MKITYVHDSFKVTKTKSFNSFSTWDNQILKINEGGLQKPINIFNIYQAPMVQNEKYREFIQEISPLLVSMEKENSECIVAGDFNIDLLKINEKAFFSEFFDTLTENTFYPKITLPTRFMNTCGTLIDNLYCKLTKNTIDNTSGILIKRFLIINLTLHFGTL